MNNWWKPILHNKAQKLKISKKFDSKLCKNLKHIGNRSQNNNENDHSDYITTKKDWSLSKDENKSSSLKSLNLNSKSDDKNICIRDDFSSTEKNHQPSKILSKPSFDNQLLKSSKTYNKPKQKLKQILMHKKSVRFNDDDLCSFAPSQHIENNVLPNESENLFEECMSIWKSKETKNTVEINEGNSMNKDKMLLSLRQNDNSNTDEESISKEVVSNTYTNHENKSKEKYTRINDKELVETSDFDVTTKSYTNNSIIRPDTEQPIHLANKFITNEASGFEEYIQSSNPDNSLEINTLSLVENGSVSANSTMDVKYKKRDSSVVRKTCENLLDKQSHLKLISINHKMANENQMQYTDVEDATVETNCVESSMKYAHDKLPVYIQINSTDESGDMNLHGHLLLNKTKFNDADVFVDNVNEGLYETNNLDVVRDDMYKQSISEDIVHFGNKNYISVDNTSHTKMKNLISCTLPLIRQGEQTLPKQTEYKKANDLNNSVFGCNTDLEINSKNKKVAHIIVEDEGKSGSDNYKYNFNDEFTYDNSSDENDSVCDDGHRKISVIINRQSDSEDNESDLENNDSFVYSSCELSEVKMGTKEMETTDYKSEDEIPSSQIINQNKYLVPNVRKNKLNKNGIDYSCNQSENITEKKTCDYSSSEKIIRKENSPLVYVSPPDDSDSEILSSKNIKTGKTSFLSLSKPNLYNDTESQLVNKYLKKTGNKICVTNVLKLNIKPDCNKNSFSKTNNMKNSIRGENIIKSCNEHERNSFVASFGSIDNNETRLKCSVTDTIQGVNLFQHEKFNNEHIEVTVNECYGQNDKENTLSYTNSEETTLVKQKVKIHISSPINTNVTHKMNLVSGNNILNEDYYRSETFSTEKRNIKIPPTQRKFSKNDEWNQEEKQCKLFKPDGHECKDTIFKNKTTEGITQTTNVQSFVNNHVSEGVNIIENRRVHLHNTDIYNNKTDFNKIKEIEDKSKTEVDSSKDLNIKRDCGTEDTNKTVCSTKAPNDCTEKLNLTYSKQHNKKNQTKKKKVGSLRDISLSEDMKMPNEETCKEDEKIVNIGNNVDVSRVSMEDVSNNDSDKIVKDMNSCVSKETILLNMQTENQKLNSCNENHIQSRNVKNITELFVEKEKESHDEFIINNQFINVNLDENDSLYDRGNKQDSAIINRQFENKECLVGGINVGLTDKGFMDANIALSKSSESESEDEIPPSQTIEQKGYITPCYKKSYITKNENNDSYKQLENAPQKMNCYDKHTPEINEKEKSCALNAKIPNVGDAQKSLYKKSIRKSLFSLSSQVCLLDAQLSGASENIQKKCTVLISDVVDLETRVQHNNIKNTNAKNMIGSSESNRMKLYDRFERDNLVLNSENSSNIDKRFSVSDVINISNTLYKEENNGELKVNENTYYIQKPKVNRISCDVSEKITLTLDNERMHTSSISNINSENLLGSCKSKILPETYNNYEQGDKNKKVDSKIMMTLPIQLHDNNKVNGIPTETSITTNKLLKPFTDGDKKKISVPPARKNQECILKISNDKIKAAKVCVSELRQCKTNKLHCTSPMKLNKKMNTNFGSSPILMKHKHVNNEEIIGKHVKGTMDNNGLTSSIGTFLNSPLVERNTNALKFGRSDSIISYKSNHKNDLETIQHSSIVNEENSEYHEIYLTTDKIRLQRNNVDIPEGKDSQRKYKRKSKYKHTDNNKCVKKVKMSSTGIIKNSMNKSCVETFEITGEETKLVNEHNINLKGTGNTKMFKNIDYIQSRARTKQPFYKIFDNNSNNEDSIDSQEDTNSDCRYFERNNNINKKNNKSVEDDTKHSKLDLVAKKRMASLSKGEVDKSNSLPVKVRREESYNNSSYNSNKNDNHLSDGSGEDANIIDPVIDELITSTETKNVGSTSTFQTDSVYSPLVSTYYCLYS